MATLHDQPKYETKIEFVKSENVLEIEKKKIEIKIGESEFDKREREREETENKSRKVIPRESSNVKIVGESNEQCIVYAHRVTGNDKIHGWAGDLSIEETKPIVGAVVKTWEGSGHVAIVIGIDGDTLTVRDANYLKGFITERTLSINSSLIAGYIY